MKRLPDRAVINVIDGNNPELKIDQMDPFWISQSLSPESL